MDKELRALLQDYLYGSQTLEAIRLWVAHNIWEAFTDQDSLADHVAIELTHLTEGLTDEEYFRCQVQDMLWLLPEEERTKGSVASATNTELPVPEGTYDQSTRVIRRTHSFA